MINGIKSGDVLKMASHYRLRWEDAQQSYVLLYPEGIVRLNGPAAAIMKQCDRPTPLEQILSRVQALYPTDEVEVDVREFLEEAMSNGWVTVERA